MIRNTPEYLGSRGDPPRDVQLLEVGSADEVVLPKLRSQRFVCAILWDAEHSSVASIVELVERLLDAGAVYFCVWGTDCERVHDIIDEITRDLPLPRDDDVIMTTWHAAEPLLEAATFALNDARPTDGLAEGCDSVCFLSIGPAAWGDEIRTMLRAQYVEKG